MRVPLMRLVLVGALVSATGCSHTQPPPPDHAIAPPIPYKGRFFTFPSGMRLVVNESPQASEFLFDVSYAVGGRDEEPGKSGLAHLCEHMAFRGRHLGPGQPTLGERLNASGAEANAYTSLDATDYFERGKPDQLGEMIALEAQRMRDPLAGVTEAEFEAEREVVINEIRQRSVSRSGEEEMEAILALAFPGTPYAHDFGGTPEGIRKLTLDDVRAWFHRYYVPERTILVMNGPRASAEVARLVEAMFGALAKGKPGAPRVAPLERPAPTIDLARLADPELKVRRMIVEKPQLVLIWTAPGAYSHKEFEGHLAASATEEVLWRVFHDDERVESVGADYIPFDGAGFIGAIVTLKSEENAVWVVKKAREAIDGAFKANIFSAYETARLRGRLLNTNYLLMDHPSGGEAAQYVRATGNPDYIGGREKQIREEFKHDIAEYEALYIAPSRMHALLIAPDNDRGTPVSTTASPGGSAERFDDVAEAAAGTVTADQILAVAVRPGLDRVERRQLANGLTVVIARRGTTPIVDARLVIRTPLSANDPVGVADLATEVSWSGLKHKWVHEIGGHSLRDVDPFRIVFGATVPSGNVDNMLADAAEWLDDPGPDVDIWDAFTPTIERAAERADTRPATRAVQALRAGIFPNHPYGQVVTAAAFDDISRRQVSRWLSRVLQPSNAELILVGDVNPTPEFWAKIEQRLGSWKGEDNDPPPPMAPFTAPKARRVVLVDRPDATQAEIRLAVVGPELDQTGEVGLRALAWYAEKHLTRVLREERGVTYGVAPWNWRMPAARVFGLRTSVEAKAAAPALTFMLDRLRELKERPLAEPLVAQARWHVAREFALEFDYLEDAAEGLESIAAHQRPADYWETYPKAIAQLSPAALQAVANQLNIGAETIVVIGDQKILLPQLQQAGLQVEVSPAPSRRKHP